MKFPVKQSFTDRTANALAIALCLAAVTPDVAGETEKTTLGGYGELHLNYAKPEGAKAAPPVLDFHRFVLFFGYDWNEQWAFRSELELEHNLVEGGAPTGELELEQAFVQWSPQPEFNFSAGVLLPAVGIINEHHEPPTFLSVERPDYAKVIVPTTWFGNGIGVGGTALGMVEYSLQFMEGLDDRKFRSKDAIRAGRRKGFKAPLDNLLTVAAADFVGLPGATGGFSVALNELVEDDAGGHLYERALLWEVHGKYDANGVVASGEFGSIHYTAADTAAGQLENSQGFYLDAGYDVARFWGAEQLRLIPFVRYSLLNPAGSLAGSAVNEAAGQYKTHLMGGVALMPIPQVTLKFDVASVADRTTRSRETQVSAGAGYAF